MSPLRRSNEYVTIDALYDGDVIRHPETGDVMTVLAAMQSVTITLELAPGLIEVGEGGCTWDGVPSELTLERGEESIHRIHQYFAREP